MEKFDIRKQRWEPVIVGDICIGIGRKDQNGVYEMLCNSILPESGTQMKEEKFEDVKNHVLWDMEILATAMNYYTNKCKKKL